MRLDTVLDDLSRGWRGPLVAALLALIAGLPGLLAMPPLDRDESRFAQATTQMLETGDYVMIAFQDQPRFKKPVGIHWAQAASVKLFSHAEDRAIWAYRLPSLLAAMLAAAALTWGAAGFFGARAGLLAGAMLGCSMLLSSEAGIAKTDAALCAFTTLAMAALGRIYGAARGGPPAGWRSTLLMWLGVSLGVLIKGPLTPMVFGLGLVALAVWDRKAGLGWLKKLSWGWGLILLLAIGAPWATAITVTTDGRFWTEAIGGDLGPKLAAGGQEGHAAPFGLHTLLLPLLTFPSALVLPAAAVLAWRERRSPGVRFAVCWFLPAFLAFEISPTKLVHYTLPTFGGVFYLAATALSAAWGRIVTRIGAGLSVGAGLILAAAALYLAIAHGAGLAPLFAILTALLFLAAGGVGGWLLLRGRRSHALGLALVLGVAAHGVLLAGLGPRLNALWVSRAVADALERADLNPRTGAVAAPVAVAGYAEPSLVFALGTQTGLGDAKDAAQAIADGRPAVVESREQQAFSEAMDQLGLTPRPAGEVSGLDYSNGDEVMLSLYRGEPAAAGLQRVR